MCNRIREWLKIYSPMCYVEWLKSQIEKLIGPRPNQNQEDELVIVRNPRPSIRFFLGVAFAEHTKFLSATPAAAAAMVSFRRLFY